MSRRIPDYLQLYIENQTNDPATAADDPHVQRLLESFQQLAGCDVKLQSGADQHVRLICNAALPNPTGANQASDRDRREWAEKHAAVLTQLLNELAATRRELLLRETELATAIPVVQRPQDRQQLADRLQSLLKLAVETIGCDAAAAYLLDDATSYLKLRAMWGLPDDRLLLPPRPLHSAIADLEAMLGHAVVLEDTGRFPHWNIPEEFASAACVPIMTPSTLLGTLWMFSASPRQFSTAETNVMEITAGRLAVELERAVLIAQCQKMQQHDRQLESAARWQRQQHPQVHPPLDQWQLAGWSEPRDVVSGAFFDWAMLPDGRLAVALGDVHVPGLLGVLAAAQLRGIVHAHWSQPAGAKQLLTAMHETLCSASVGDVQASLVLLLADPEPGTFELAWAGSPGAVIVGRGDSRAVGRPAAHLGVEPWRPEHMAGQLEPGQSVVLLTDGVRRAIRRHGQVLGEEAIAASLRHRHRATAREMVQVIRALVETYCPEDPPADHAVVVVKRRLA